MPSSSPGEGRKLSRLRRWTAKRSNSSKKQQAFGWRSIEILEAVAEAIPDPSQISPEMCMEISHLATLFCDINRYFDSLLMHPSTPLIQLGPLRSQLDAAYSKFVRGKEPRTLQIFRAGFSMASVADILTTALRVIDRGADVFPPLKSAVGGALALKDVTQGVRASKTRAQQLRQNISNILDIIPFDSVGVSNYLESLRRKLQQLDELSRQSFLMRLKNLNRNNELLLNSQTDVDRYIHYILLIRAFRKKKRRRKPPESSRFLRTKDLYVLFSVSSAFF
ncbi:hypothetical protein K435DRAFT_844052 [Dendrothele bispora CBS 962.96]|uniref:Fungal STAND N-terminal Goodbye domain-containing protein n=1 Tax=Dendrothele bispora (strain CBS 962.96) TaxID=1314807 RepID=A0A4S8L4V3_DENBC|nr:hypothetical protein K435DRAFT_844052 [Dendrothele bispora CBS 962.96]